MTVDRTFDWVPRFDEKSRRFSVTAKLAEERLASTATRPRFWTPGALLDQGPDGACVGFGWSAELAASPVRVLGITNQFAKAYYEQCKRIDEWPGENYSGTSVLAGAKVATSISFVGSYHWAFSIEEFISALVNLGPAVIGVEYPNTAFDTRPSGLIDWTGAPAGGHCMLVRGYHPSMRIPGEGWFKRHEVLVVRQSWGPFGVRDTGDFYLPVSQLADRFRGGEYCIPAARKGGDVARTPLSASALPR